MKRPTFTLERKLAAEGFFVVGVDEVGCGSLAGPVLAAAVHLPVNVNIPFITDSKLLTAQKREEIFFMMLKKNVPMSFGMATPEEIDQLNIRKAGLIAMRRAVMGHEKATYALVDAWKIPDIDMRQQGIIKGDQKIRCIAAASIAAKVVRDWMMAEYDLEFPGYDFASHKGYSTRRHHAFLKEKGITPLHRKTFLKKIFQGELF